ncbi:MAG: Gfo/Idh/MocA family protein [Armatimonadota bacterium]
MKTYRVGIIGLGRMGSTICDEVAGYPAFPLPFSIAAAARASDRLELACGCDLLPEKREAFRERWGVSALYEDFRQMIEQERPDMVAICTKGVNHAELGIAVTEMGVPMLYLEKAMACSMSEADGLRDACQKHHTAFNTGVLRRFDARYWWARKLIERGEIGTPHTVVQYSGGTLLHGGIHIVDTMMYLLGDPKIISVRGELRPTDTVIENNRLDHDPSAVFELAFEGGATGYAISGGGWDIEVFGSEGSLKTTNNGIDWSWRKSCKDADKWPAMREAAYPKVGTESLTVNCLEDLVRAHEGGGRTLNHIEQCHHSTEVCLAVAESHRQGGSRVTLPLQNRDLYIWHA